MATMKFLVPEATTNYIKNPAARYDTTGIVAAGSAVYRDRERVRFGVAAYRVETNGAAIHEGFYYRVSGLTGINDPVNVSAYVRGTGVVRIRLIDNPSGDEWASQPVVLTDLRWRRIEVSGRCTGSDDMRLYVETAGEAAQDVIFYVDGLQMERKAYATTYCAGDQPDCYWNGTKHNSISLREAHSRLGGRWIEIAGPEREAENLYMTVIGGFGVAPIRTQTQPYADAPGDSYQNYKVLSRPITMTFHTKRDYKARTEHPPTLEPLHKLRQQLIDIVKPDKVGSRQPFWIEYQDGDKPLYLQAYYEGGLEGEWDIRNEFYNSFPIRLLATAPFFTEDDMEAQVLTFRTTKTVNYVARRFDGLWSEMNGGVDDQIRAMALGRRGEIIVVGDFTVANNAAGATDPFIFANHIAYWDGEKWNQYGTGADGIIYDLAVAANGDVYVTGAFTNIGGVAANYVAYWDGSWHAMGAGLDDVGYAIRISPEGDVYVGGAFVNAGGDPMNYITRWDGSWNNIGAGPGLNGAVYTIAISNDGTSVFLGGAFTDENGDPGILDLNYVGVYYPDLDTFMSLGVGFDAAVRKLRWTEAGRLYAVGDFTESNDSALVLLYIAFWNGASWFAIDIGADDIVRDLDISPFGSIIFGGDFTRIGGEDAIYFALWNGSAYVNMDVQAGAPCYAVLYDDKGNIFIAPNGTDVNYANRTTVNNKGTAETHPFVYIVGPCTLRWIENQTTKKRVYIDLDILDDEEVFIDFGRGKVESTVRGSLAYAVNPGSDFRAWVLAPGDNVLSALALNDVDASMQISYMPRHWGVDASPDVEEL